MNLLSEMGNQELVLKRRRALNAFRAAGTGNSNADWEVQRDHFSYIALKVEHELDSRQRHNVVL